LNGGVDSLYDHEVTVAQIGTNHDPTDDQYYSDNNLYFDYHGACAVVLQLNNEGAYY
jgi:hypothetical protein